MGTDTVNRKLIQEKEEITRDLLREIKRWEYIKRHGCQDPFWPDGTNMNLVRNHIIHDKNRLIEICESLDISLPEEYYLPTPPKVDNDYMCKNGEYFTRRAKNIEQLGNKITTKLPKICTNGQTELF